MRNNNYIEENYEYNIGRLRQHGYPDTKDKELKEKMQQGDSRILLEFHSAEYAGNVRATVHIEKADSGAYFPNRYELELKRPDSQYARRQFFQIQNFKGHGRQYDIPWRMGVNLLRGGQVLNHWLKGDGSSIYEWRGLNFSQRTSAGHGYVSFEPQVFDVEKKLDELPILEKDKEDLRHSHVVRSIETGNSQVVHLGIPGNPTIRLRANVPKRDLDIINGGHVISITQFNADLEEMKNQDIQMKAPENETHTPEKETQRKVLPSINQESNQHSALLEAGEKMGNVLIVGASGNETSKMVDVTDQVKKILTGNPITPHPSNNPGNHVKHGM